MIETDITTHIVAVLGIVKKGNKYLLAKRSKDDPQEGGKWSIPGGKVDLEIEANIIQNTLKREIREEVGIEIEDNIELIYNNSFIRSSGHHVVLLVFLCIYKSGIASPLEDHEEIAWLSIDEIVKMKDGLPGYTYDKFEALMKLRKK